MIFAHLTFDLDDCNPFFGTGTFLVLKTDFCGKEVQLCLFFTCGGQQYNTSVYHKYTYKLWLRILASFCVQKFHTCLWHYANSVRWLLCTTVRVCTHTYMYIPVLNLLTNPKYQCCLLSATKQI